MTVATVLGLDLAHSRCSHRLRLTYAHVGACNGAWGLGAISAILVSDNELSSMTGLGLKIIRRSF